METMDVELDARFLHDAVVGGGSSTERDAVEDALRKGPPRAETILAKPLTVAELIAQLRDCPQDALVVTVAGDMGLGFAKQVERTVGVGGSELIQYALSSEAGGDADPPAPGEFGVPAVMISPYPGWDER